MRLLLAAVGLILAAALAALVCHGRPRVADRLFATLLPAGCAIGLWPAIGILRGGPPAVAAFPGSLPGGPWSFGVDPLTAWFLIPLLGVGACAGAFGVGYLAPERGRRAVAAEHALFAVLLTAMIGVVTAQAMAPFLASWEVMAVSAYLLVLFEHDQAEVRRAGLIYIVLTHLSTLALMGMFAALGAFTGGRSFADLAAARPAAGPAFTLVLLLALLGFGIKAGAVPLHFWLPGAHAAAPSHVSAVLSGVMLKMGIYGLCRVLSMVGPTPPWFGWTLFGVGLASGVLGVLWALAQHEMKRLLAYHSVENIGIILLGLGVGSLGLSYGRPAVALLGFTGALLHTLNHALFKGLLFLGAGAVLRATGTQLIDRLGGLGRELPWTALAFGVGSAAIVGLPPLNGFVSEWVVFRGTLAAGASGDALRFAVVGAAGLGLIGALALACFAKLDAVVFLGRRRFPGEGHAAPADPPAGMLAPMLVLAGACVTIGLLPVLVLGAARVAGLGIAGPVEVSVVAADWTGAATRISALGFGLIAVAGIALLLRRAAGSRMRPRLAGTWGCAASVATPRMQYTASSFAAPLLAAFGPVAGVREQRHGAVFHTEARDPALDAAVLPAWHGLGRLSARLREVQGGRLRWYLLLVILTLLALLYYLASARPVP